MNPNSISHRLFAAALSPGAPATIKRPVRDAVKDDGKKYLPRPEASTEAAAQKLSAWTWSGWQHTTI